MQQTELHEASAALPALVAQVEAGDEVVLMREGRVVARIVPESDKEPISELTPEEQARAKRALEGIRQLREKLNLGPFDFEEFKRDRDEGRL